MTVESNDDALCSARVRWQAKDVEDFFLTWLWPGRLPDVDGAAAAALQGGGDAMLACECFAQGVPGVVDTLRLQLQAQGMDEVVGHQGTYIAGVVTDGISSQSIPNASVRLYYYKAQSASSGCFALGGPDALPFEFSVSAPGYMPVVVKAVPGFYQAAVQLIPVGGSGKSASTVREISRERYADLSRGRP